MKQPVKETNVRSTLQILPCTITYLLQIHGSNSYYSLETMRLIHVHNYFVTTLFRKI